ncbi:MAG TPA: hypothetical protein VHQ90_13760 [Thermoanaerobaculia bacterium]|nr:hypothetical protein [Thermoanaerobaculia bacterium]
MEKPSPDLIAAEEGADFDAASLTPAEVERLTRPQWSWRLWGIWAVSATAFYYSVLRFKVPKAADDLLGVALGGLWMATFWYTIFYFAKRAAWKALTRRIRILSMGRATAQLQDNLGSDFFTNLVKINFRYLDRYYLQTQIQSAKSFALAAVAAAFGFAVVIVSVYMMLDSETEPAYVTAGAGTISEFIAAIFFYLYNRTVLKMSEYHQKLVITQNIALALKVSEGLAEESRGAAQLALISALTADVNRLLAGVPRDKAVSKSEQ